MKKIAHTSLVALTAGAFALSSLGMAVEGVAQETAQVSGSLVNQLNIGDTAKLTIHKIKGGFNGENPWGVAKEGVSGEPLDGIAFDIYKLDPDLTTLQGWKDYDALSGQSVSELIERKEPVATVTTATVGGEKGVATFEGCLLYTSDAADE